MFSISAKIVKTKKKKLKDRNDNIIKQSRICIPINKNTIIYVLETLQIIYKA